LVGNAQYWPIWGVTVAGVLVAVATALALDDLSYVTSYIHDERDERGEGRIGLFSFFLAGLAILEILLYFKIFKALMH